MICLVCKQTEVSTESGRKEVIKILSNCSKNFMMVEVSVTGRVVVQTEGFGLFGDMDNRGLLKTYADYRLVQ